MNKLLLILSLLQTIACSASAGDTPLIVNGNDRSMSAYTLVFGGTGRLGSDIVKALLQSGRKVTVFARKSSTRQRLEGLDVDFVIGDVLDLESVVHATKASGANVVIDALARGSSGPEFYQISAKNIAAAAVRAKVDQIILHGSVGAGDSAAAYAHLGPSAGMQKLMAEKTAGEAAVRASQIDYTIIRNGHLIAYGTPETGNANLYTDQTETGSVTRLGLARLTDRCILNSECYNKIYHAIDKSLDTK